MLNLKNIINIQKINSDSGFLSQMDMTNLAIKIGNSSSCDIHMFRACIAELYIRSTIGKALKEDGERIGKLKTELENLNKDEFDRIKKMQIRYLILDLDKAKESYGNQSRGMGINEGQSLSEYRAKIQECFETVFSVKKFIPKHE